MPEAQRQEWERLECASIEPSMQADKRGEIEYVAQYEATLRTALAARKTRLHKRSASAKPVVAVGVSSTTRTLTVRSLEDLALFRIMLPSLVRTAEVGFEYWVYIAYDVGDKFFDSSATGRAIVAWASEHLVGALAGRGIEVSLLLLRFNNTVRKPGPVFNYMMGAAYEDGADYLYRINDDTELEGSGWTSQAIAALHRFGHVGVVGPICYEGNVNILTHDFVHRTHLEVFELYYPPVFSDWYMDDWISKVYGPARTQKGPFLVTHHINQHATRYAVDRSHELALAHELETGGRRIKRWCEAHAGRCVPPSGSAAAGSVSGLSSGGLSLSPDDPLSGDGAGDEEDEEIEEDGGEENRLLERTGDDEDDLLGTDEDLRGAEEGEVGARDEGDEGEGGGGYERGGADGSEWQDISGQADATAGGHPASGGLGADGYGVSAEADAALLDPVPEADTVGTFGEGVD
jgi:hypothetical protein